MPAMKIKATHIHLAIGLGCLAGLAIAVGYMQEQLGLLPCPLCVIQRIAFILVALTALAAAAFHPRGPGRWLFGLLLLLWSSAGAAVAGWQVYLTYHPHAAECGISPEEKFLNSLPLSKWWPAMFEARGDCRRVDWTFLGLSVPELSLIAFVLLALAALVAALRKP
jgi:disulfide bond formation protein DsbB